MNSWTLNPETERIRKERNAKANHAARNGSHPGSRGVGAGTGRSPAPNARTLKLGTQDGIGGTPSPVSKDADVGGIARAQEMRVAPATSFGDAVDVSAQAQHAYHQWQEHFWGARERTFNRQGIREL